MYRSPCRLCPHIVVVVGLEHLWGYAVEPLIPNRTKVKFQAKRDMGFTLWAMVEARFREASGHQTAKRLSWNQHNETKKGCRICSRIHNSPGRHPAVTPCPSPWCGRVVNLSSSGAGCETGHPHFGPVSIRSTDFLKSATRRLPLFVTSV